MKVATITTNKGNIRIELFDDKTPNTVANFEKLANMEGVKLLTSNKIVLFF